MGRLADLTREIIVRSFYRRSACRPCRYSLPQTRIGLSWSFKNPASQRFSK